MTKEGYQKNKYLDDLGIPITQYGTNYIDNTDPHWEDWQKEKEKYGFDPRECWSLGDIFVEWIYSHFMKYKDDAGQIIDLSYYEFQYYKTPNDVIPVTQEEAIDIICQACKDYLLDDSLEKEYLSEGIIKLIGDIMPAMWW